MAKKDSSAFMKPLLPDETLARVTGPDPLSRSGVANKLWGYIREKNLQDPLDRRLINSDDLLRPIFGGKAKISMFEMTALVSKHLS